MRRLVAVVVSVGALVLGSALAASAGEKHKVLFDRGLPATNLNNPADTNRSNVAWADWEQSVNPRTGQPSEYWLPGDDFTIPQRGRYKVRTIRVWVVGEVPGGEGEHRGDREEQFTLWGGTYATGITPISARYSVTPINYPNTTEGYQGRSGLYRQINQIDFHVDVDLSGGETFTFFVEGPWTNYDPSNPTTGGVVNAFLHASNRLMSSAPPRLGVFNDWFLFLHRNAEGTVGVETWNSKTGEGTQCPPESPSFPCLGWDKPSDANVQVLGERIKK